jgi:membrane fusion protein, multidrug efflux system
VSLKDQADKSGLSGQSHIEGTSQQAGYTDATTPVSSGGLRTKIRKGIVAFAVLLAACFAGLGFSDGFVTQADRVLQAVSMPPFATQAASGIRAYLPVTASPGQAKTLAQERIVSIARVTADDVPIILTSIGTVQAANTVNLRSRVDGQITDILFKEGQKVKAGDVLVKIDARVFEAQFKQYEAARQKSVATLDSALLDLRRREGLIGVNAVSQQSLDQQKSLVEQLRAQILADEAQMLAAKTQLSYTTIASPIDAYVGIRQIDVGNIIRASDNTTIVTLNQLQPITAIFSVSAAETYRFNLAPGLVKLPVTAFAADDQTPLDQGVVEVIDNAVDPATGTIKIKATFPNKDLKLWPGHFVNARITVNTRRQGLTIPSVAIRNGPRGPFVWVLQADSTVQFRNVTAGQVFGNRTLIEQGLARGDRVIVEGMHRLENGVKVEVRPEGARVSAQDKAHTIKPEQTEYAKNGPG